MQYNEFPKFVADQLLTPEHLNQVFNHLDEQERLTRTCLLGIGIVCGLQVGNNPANTEVSISKGCGITSSGYLVQVPATTYTEYVAFDPVRERYYDRFVNLGTKQKKFNLYELVQAGVIEESQPLTPAFLADKVVLLFVELLEESAKNCDPNSCDNKGVRVTVNFRPLLVAQADVAALKTGAGSKGISFEDVLKLPELRMARVDIPATALLDTAAVFEAFLDPFTDAFLKLVESALTKSFKLFGSLAADVYSANPFAGLANQFRFLARRTLTPEQLLHTQYYYDLFSDLLAAYDELRQAGTCLAGLCCPDDLFPRHLLLGEAVGYRFHAHSDYRHYFLPSPILSRQPCLLTQIRSLLIRLALLVERFNVPETRKAAVAEAIRITPSTLGDQPLSRKAIPYYYAVTQSPRPLFLQWDYLKTRAGQADRNLSYHASDYNSGDDPVRRPLHYDLEPYNFLRIEGHLGLSATASLAGLEQQRSQYRLPIDVIALSTDVRSLRAALAGGAKDAAALARAGCHFHDLEAQYATLEKHLICFLCKEMKYYYGLTNSTDKPGAANRMPTTALLKRCDPDFRYAPRTFGETFEAWYSRMGKLPYVTAEGILATSGYAAYVPLFNRLSKARETVAPETMAAMTVAAAAGGAADTAAAAPASSLTEVQVVVFSQLMVFILYYIEKLSETLKGSLASFDLDEFQERFDALQRVATAYKALPVGQSATALALKLEELFDHLDKLIYCCDPSEFRALVAEWQRRWRSVDALRRLAYFARKCPGLQHKAGVPMGGTFILVYHEKPATSAAVGGKIVAAKTGDRLLDELAENVAAKKSKLDKLIDQIPDGTVIADFYVPFICCSDCPPVHFEVVAPEKPEEPPPAPTIAISPTEFCNDNKGPVAITVTPPGGAVTGEGASGDAGAFAFSPAAVAVGDLKVKEVTLTYTVGAASASVVVKVYHKPGADFRVVQDPAAGPGHVEVVDASTFAESYSWDFGDKTDPVTTPKAGHDYKQSGDYVITLTVRNGTCMAQQKVPVRIRLETVRTCFPVPSMVEAFEKLRELGPNQFGVFRERIGSFERIEAFFKDLAVAGALSPEKELEFHLQHEIEAQLPKWLGEVQVSFLEFPELRVLAAELYRVLMDLTTRLACFQEEDIEAAKVPTQAIFKLALSHVKRWIAPAPDTAPPARERIKMLLEDFHREEERLKADDAGKKPNYVKALAALIKVLDAYPF